MVEHNFSEGARLLIEAGTVRAVAKALGVSERAIFSYRRSRRPSDAIQQKMWELFKIPTSAWTQLAGMPAVAKVAAEALTQEEATESPTSRVAPSDAENAVQRLRAQCARLRATREAGNLTPRALVEIEQLELRCSAQLARLTTHAITETQILASAPWQTLCERLTETLAEVDVLALAYVAAALDPEAPSEIDRLRRACPEQVAACERANTELRAALAAALRKRETRIQSPSLREAISQN